MFWLLREVNEVHIQHFVLFSSPAVHICHIDLHMYIFELMIHFALT